MKFTIETNALQNVVKSLGIVTKANTSDPEGRVLIKTNEDGTISFISNNNSIAISIGVDKVTIEDEGAVSILYSKIKNFVSSFPAWNGEYGSKEFIFIEKKNKINIRVNTTFENGKKAKGNLSIETFPALMIHPPTPVDKPKFILNSETYKMAVSKVIYAVDPYEIRQSIQGMFVSFDADHICFTGTNGLMLSEYKAKNTSNIKEGDFIIKYDFVMALRRLLNEETQVFFDIDERSIRAKVDDVTISGRLVIGDEFPVYKYLFDNYEHTTTISKDILMSNLLPFMDVLATDDNNRLTLSIIDKQFKLKNDYAEFSYDEDVDIDNIDFVIDINGNFMKQTIEAIKDDKLIIKFSDSEGLLIFDSGNFEDQKALITPVKRRAEEKV